MTTRTFYIILKTHFWYSLGKRTSDITLKTHTFCITLWGWKFSLLTSKWERITCNITMWKEKEKLQWKHTLSALHPERMNTHTQTENEKTQYSHYSASCHTRVGNNAGQLECDRAWSISGRRHYGRKRCLVLPVFHFSSCVHSSAGAVVYTRVYVRVYVRTYVRTDVCW